MAIKLTTTGGDSAARADARRKAQEADEPMMRQARQRLIASATAESGLRLRMFDDQRFSANVNGLEQWDPQALAIRTREDRPVLTIDRLSQPIFSIANAARGAGDRINVEPVDEDADRDTADVIGGLIRNIEHGSHANLAYIWARDAAVRMGRGWLRVISEYSRPLTVQQFKKRQFSRATIEQDLRIKRVLDHFKVYPDPEAEEMDYSDQRYAFLTRDLTLTRFRELYGEESSVLSFEAFAGLSGDERRYWAPEGHVRLAEYYDMMRTAVILHSLKDQTGAVHIVADEDLEQARAALAAQSRFFEGDGVAHELEVRQLKWYLLNGLEAMERRDLPGIWIPLVPAIGEEVYVSGERDFRGIVRGAKDAIRGYHTQVTALMEATNLIPKAPFVVAAGQVEQYKEIWSEANRVNFAYLPYKETSVGGHLVPPPQRNPAMPPLGPFIAAIAQMDNDIKASTRHFDPSLGRAGPEESGLAITARQRQGQLGSSHFDANFRDVTLAHLGRILIDLIPHYYDAERTVRIVGEDDLPKVIRLNQQYRDPAGVDRLYDMSVGQYDAVVRPGPGYVTRQEETRDLLTKSLGAAPNLFGLIGDLYFKALGLTDIAKRLEKTLPPELQPTPEGETPIPPAAAMELQQLRQQLEAVGQQLMEARQALDTQRIKAESQERIAVAQLESRERIEAADRQITLAELRGKQMLAEAELRHQEAQATIQARLDELKILVQSQGQQQTARSHTEQLLNAERQKDEDRALKDRARREELAQRERERFDAATKKEPS